MNTILEKIFKNDSNDELDNLNNNFFKNYIDKDLILKLVDIRNLYLDILSFEKTKAKEERNRYLIKTELEKLLKDKNKITDENFGLISKKNALLKSLDDSINIKKLEIDSKLNELIIKNLNSLKKINLDIEKKKKEFDSLKFNNYDRDLLINTLKYKLNNLKDIDDYTDSYDKKELYEDELSVILNNKSARKCYITYLFLSISLDLDNLYHTYRIANLFAFDTFKNERTIALENTSINLEVSLIKSLKNALDNYIKLINDTNMLDSEITNISEEKLKHISIINAMNHFAKNHSSLSDDKDIKRKEYNMIKEFIDDLKNDVDMTNDKNMKIIINDTISIFDNFTANL